jgi:hypothetical protein
VALSLKKQIEKYLNSRISKAMDEVSELIPAQIRKRTQLGKDLKGGKIKPIENSTKAYRKRYSKNLDSNTTPNRSNLTATGQLLNSIESKAKGLVYEITLKDKRSKDLSGSTSKASNTEIKDFQEKQGRFFWGLTDFEKVFIVRELIKRLKNK